MSEGMSLQRITVRDYNEGTGLTPSVCIMAEYCSFRFRDPTAALIIEAAELPYIEVWRHRALSFAVRPLKKLEDR